MSNLQELQNKINAWSDRKFGNSGSLDGTIEHLIEEAEHLKESPNDPMAMADVYILLLRIAGQVGFDVNDLYLAAEAKFTINQSRDWLEPDERGIIRHKN